MLSHNLELIQRHLAEIQQEAEAKDNGDGHAGMAYRKACKSIQACPIPYNSINELLQLQNVGKVMVSKLQKKQKEYYAARGEEVPDGGGGGNDGAAEVVAPETSARKRGGANGAGKKRANGGRARKETDDSNDDGLAEDSAFARRLQAGGGSESLHRFQNSVAHHVIFQVIERPYSRLGEPRGKD
jgi:hypothetical protein